MATSEQSDTPLTAKYASSSDSKTFVYDLSTKASPNATVAEKTAHLSEVRSNVKKLQESINAFLTEKMAEDKARETDKGSKKTQDEIEEEKYGEEPAEDD